MKILKVEPVIAWALVRNKKCELPGHIEMVRFSRTEIVNSAIRYAFDLVIKKVIIKGAK